MPLKLYMHPLASFCWKASIALYENDTPFEPHIFFDLHIHVHRQNIVADRLRPADQKDPTGVQYARSMLQLAYGMLEQRMANKTWALGDQFTMADCAASPALYYGHLVQPLTNHPHTLAYLERLQSRPAFARVIEEAQPYFHHFPRH